MAKKSKKQIEADENEDLISTIKDQYKEAKQHTSQWRTETIESYDFVSGRQWDSVDEAQLKEEERPIITFNRMGPYFDAISGYEINNRQQIKYLPRTTDDSKQNELLNAAVKYIREKTNAEDEESDAFLDMLVSGYGWIETSMDYEEDVDGMVRLSRIDPLEMSYDPNARKKNATDRKWQQRIRWMTEDEIEERWPDAEIAASTDIWESDTKSEPHNASLAFLYRENGSGYDEKSGRYRVVQHQYYENEEFYRVLDEEAGNAIFLTSAKFKIAQASAEQLGVKLQFVKQKKRIYKQIFLCGDEILEQKDLPCGFTFKCMTGKRDRNLNIWFGLARVMKDPQRWANKFLSQTLHVINSNSKGGLLAEEGAFVDPRKAEEQWSNPASVTLLKNGALSSNKIKEREPIAYPQGLDRMLQYAISAIPDVTGVNMEFLGASDREQAGVLEQERKKSAFTILAGFFDSMKLYRKEEGVLLMHFIKEYLNDGRIIRIYTEEGEQPIRLNLTDKTMEFDVIVDQAPDSPNLKQEVWGTLEKLIPQFLKAGVQFPPDIFKYSPLPADMAQKFAQGMQNKLPPEVQQKMDQLQQENQQLQQQLQEAEKKANDKMGALQSKHQLGQEKNQIHAQSENQKAQILDQASIREFQTEMAKIGQENQIAMEKLQKEMHVDFAKMQKEMELAAYKTQLEAQNKQNEMLMKMAEQRRADAETNAKEKSVSEPKETPQPIVINNYIPKAGDKKISVKRGKDGNLTANVQESE